MSTPSPGVDAAEDADDADGAREHADGARPTGRAPPAWLEDILDAAAAVRELAAAQWTLFDAELALARSATRALLLAALVATVFAVALGLTLLALAGWGLAQWFGSWAWGLGALAVLQAICLWLSIRFARRCLRWMTLPESRAQLHALVRQTSSLGEQRPHATDPSNT